MWFSSSLPLEEMPEAERVNGFVKIMFNILFELKL